jgi:hypothetical protein
MNDEDPLDEILRRAALVSSLEDPEVRKSLEQADIIWGVDVSTGKKLLFFGQSQLEDVCRGNKAVPLRICAFKFDSKTSELSLFCETVRRIKGSCDCDQTETPLAGGESKVRVYDFDRKTTQEIPAGELAPGYVHATVEGVPGTVYVDVRDKQPDWVPRHKDLSEECRRVIRYYAEAVKQVDPLPFDQRLSRFCCERDPRRELIIHFHIAYVYAHFPGHKIISPRDRHCLFSVVSHCSVSERHTAMETLDVSTLSLSRNKIQAIVDYYYDCDWMAEFRRLFDPEKMTTINE